MLEFENRPYVWWNSESYPHHKGLLEYDWRRRKTDRFIFMRSQFVSEDNYDLILECGIKEDRFQEFDILPNNIGSPIINQRTIKILSQICPDDFQAFPVTIINKPKIIDYENHEYFLINITQEVDSIDREKSYLKFWEDGKRIRDIRKLFFKPGCMGAIHLAREQYFHPLELISPTLVKAFKKDMNAVIP